MKYIAIVLICVLSSNQIPLILRIANTIFKNNEKIDKGFNENILTLFINSICIGLMICTYLKELI